jgi:hypothetical protein
MKRWKGYLMVILVGGLQVSCERKPYVEHKLQFEKVADDCKDQQSYFRMVSNFGGERYEFEKCLPPDFKKEQLVSERKGDTVLVSFKNVQDAQAGNVVYHLTLDIDSYPRYRLIIVDGTEYSIGSTEK